MTFSLVARSADARLFGMVICSSSPAVAARCAHARAGVGVVATQNITDPSLGPKILDALAALGRARAETGEPIGAVVGATVSSGAAETGTTARADVSDACAAPAAGAAAALSQVLAATPYAAYRQVLVVGSAGAPAIHSGGRTLGIVGAASGAGAAAAGNLLSSAEVPQAMLAGFERASGHFAERLLHALRAGLDAGGEAGPVHSAGLLVVRDLSWPLVDLRVDWAATDPVAELAAIWDIYSPQIEDYVCRALDPSRALGFAVPGDPSALTG